MARKGGRTRASVYDKILSDGERETAIYPTRRVRKTLVTISVREAAERVKAGLRERGALRELQGDGE